MDHPKVPTHRPNISRSLEGLDQIGSELSDFLNQYGLGESSQDSAPISSEPPQVPSTRPKAKSPPVAPEGFSFPGTGPRVPSHRPARSPDASLSFPSAETPELPSERPQQQSPEMQESETSPKPVIPSRRPAPRLSSTTSESLSSEKPDIAAPIVPSTRPAKKSSEVEEAVPNLVTSSEIETTNSSSPQVPSSKSVKAQNVETESVADTPEVSTISTPKLLDVGEDLSSNVETTPIPKVPSSRPKKLVVPCEDPKPESKDNELDPPAETVKQVDTQEVAEKEAEVTKEIVTPTGDIPYEEDQHVEDKEISPKTKEINENEKSEGSAERSAPPVIPSKRPQRKTTPITTEETSETVEIPVQDITSPEHVAATTPEIPLSRPSREKVDSIDLDTEAKRKSTMTDLLDTYQSESPITEQFGDIKDPELKLQESKKVDLESTKEEEEHESEQDISKSKPEPGHAEEAVHLKKAPPKVPKKPSSKIAQFQQRLAQQQQQDLAFLKPKAPPMRPVKKVSSISSDTSDSRDIKDERDSGDDGNSSTVGASKPKKVGKLNTDFAKNLNGMLGKGIPGMGGLPLPGMAMPGMAFGGLPPMFSHEEPSGASGENDDNESKEEKKVSDVRKGRAKGPRGRKLPGKVKEKIVVDDQSLGVEDNSKLSMFVVENAWSIKVAAKQLHSNETEESVEVDSSRDVSVVESEVVDSVAKTDESIKREPAEKEKVVVSVTKSEIELPSTKESRPASTGTLKDDEDSQEESFIEIEEPENFEEKKGPIEPDNSIKELEDLEDLEEPRFTSLKPERTSSIEKSTTSSKYEDADDFLSLDEDFDEFEDAEEHIRVRSTPKSNTPKKFGVRDVLGFSGLDEADK